MFITVFTKVLHSSLSWARSIQCISPHPISSEGRICMMKTIHNSPLQLRTRTCIGWYSGSSLELHLQGTPAWISARPKAILTGSSWLSSVAPHTFRDNTSIRLRPLLPSKSFQIHHPTIILQFDATQSKYWLRRKITHTCLVCFCPCRRQYTRTMKHWDGKRLFQNKYLPRVQNFIARVQGWFKIEIRDISYILTQPAGTKHKNQDAWSAYS
jgi:hypothetical protein